MVAEKCGITYSYYDSSENKVGNYVVQSITINGIQRALPVCLLLVKHMKKLNTL